jgi:hypothetical protein
MIVRGVPKALVPFAAFLLAACSDGSGTYALPDGCYRSAPGGVAVLDIQGSRGFIRSAGSNLQEVHVMPRVNGEGAYLTVSPAFVLRWPSMSAERGQQTAHFRIETREGGSPVILVPIEGASETELRLGAACR